MKTLVKILFLFGILSLPVEVSSFPENNPKIVNYDERKIEETSFRILPGGFMASEKVLGDYLVAIAGIKAGTVKFFYDEKKNVYFIGEYDLNKNPRAMKEACEESDYYGDKNGIINLEEARLQLGREVFKWIGHNKLVSSNSDNQKKF